MRFKSANYLKDRRGEKRVVRKFLLWPRSFNCKFSRWLEFASVTEQVHSVSSNFATMCGSDDAFAWVEVGFADDETGFKRFNWWGTGND